MNLEADDVPVEKVKQNKTIGSYKIHMNSNDISKLYLNPSRSGS
jgi:hypothetical protein